MHTNEVYIWGAGLYGERVLQNCKECDINIAGFIDSNEAHWNTEKFGLVIYPPKEILQKPDVQIIIAVANESVFAEIAETCKNAKVKNITFHELRKRQIIDALPNIKPIYSTNSPQYIVSLTSYGERLTATAPYAIATIFQQTIQPDRIILWVAYEDKEKIPQIMEKLTEKGLEIRFCEDIKSYKKLIPAIKSFPDDYIITADDDVFYPKNWLEQLLAEHKKKPNKIICHRAKEINVDENHNLLSYNCWNFCIKECESLFPTGVGGILYPPKCFHKNITNKELFMKFAPYADDIWFWAMAVINKEYFGDENPHVVVESGYSRNLQVIEPKQNHGENALWNYNSQGGNDRQLKAVVEQYPQIREYLKRIKLGVFPKISVIIPVYNTAEWLERCFVSIIKQMYSNNKIECIFVDDGSTDNSVEILQKLIENYDGKITFKIVKHKENAGLSQTRNTGVENASGEYIFFMDADDEITENALFVLAYLAQKYEDVDIIQGNTKRIESIKDGKEVLNLTWDIARFNFPEFVNDRLWIKERLGQWSRRDGYIPHSACNKLIRKNFITSNQLYFNPEHRIGEDQPWLWFVSKKIQSIAFVSSITYIYHRECPVSLSKGYNKDVFISNMLKILQTMLSNLDEEIIDIQLPFINSYFERSIKREFDKDLELKIKWQKEVEMLMKVLESYNSRASY